MNQNPIMNMRKSFLILIALLLGTSGFRAQDISVTVTPVQSVLPPQVMLYITEPANYFNVSLSNTGKDDANVYLVMQVEQVNPASGLRVSTPPTRQPKLPIVVPAGGTRILAPAEVRGLFNHIPMNEISAPSDLFTNYTNGSFGPSAFCLRDSTSSTSPPTAGTPRWPTPWWPARPRAALPCSMSVTMPRRPNS